MSVSFTKADETFMTMALEEARLAALDGDVPVGAILVRNDTKEIVAKGRNTREIMRSALGHAEVNAISLACAALDSWRLEDCTLYVTLEPCPMCAGAILHARISRVVCGAMDPVAGAMGSVWAIHRHPMENKHVKFEYGCLEEACRGMLQEFFRSRRETESL